MSKMTEAIKLAEEKVAHFTEQMKKLDEKRAKSGSFVQFLEWNTQEIVTNDTMLGLWMNIVDGLKNLKEKNADDADVIKVLKDTVEYFRERVFNHYDKFSTNPVANYIDQIQNSATRDFCSKMFSCDGLPALISYLEHNV